MESCFGYFGFVDVIDAETSGECVALGSFITNRIANTSAVNVSLTVGFSPEDVRLAMRANLYDVAFIDGLHTVDQMLLDFNAIEPFLAPKAVVVLHDIGFTNLHSGVAQISNIWHRHLAKGIFYKNLLGTMLLHRGYPENMFSML